MQMLLWMTLEMLRQVIRQCEHQDTHERPTCVSTRACSMSVLASAVRPLMATPIWVSTSAIFSMLEGSCACDMLLSPGLHD